MDFWLQSMHASHMRRMLTRMLGRRRERRLAQQLELRYRAQLDARSEAAARIADDLQPE